MATDPPYFTNPDFRYASLRIPVPTGWRADSWSSSPTEYYQFGMFKNEDKYDCGLIWEDEEQNSGLQKYNNQKFKGAFCDQVDSSGQRIPDENTVFLGWDYDRCGFTEGETKGRPSPYCPQPSTNRVDATVGKQHFQMPDGWTDVAVTQNTNSYSILMGIDAKDDNGQQRRCYPASLVWPTGEDSTRRALVSGHNLTCCAVNSPLDYEPGPDALCQDAVELRFNRHTGRYSVGNVHGFISGVPAPTGVE